ncbi:DUF3971 domain-containing protein [Lichenibacterium minor]|nr:DUF3971 domain-containing protein [Lichenibacterium minor]
MHDSSREAHGAEEPASIDEPAAACMRHLLRRQPRRKAARRRTGLRRAALALTGFTASIGFLAAVAAGALFIELRQGPISFDLKPQIVAALNARVGHGFRFDLSGTAIEATDHGPALTIRSLSVSDSAARPVVSAPSAAIAVDPMALLVGRIAPTRLDIHDVDLRLVIRPDGQVAVSAGAEAAAVPLANAFATDPATRSDTAAPPTDAVPAVAGAAPLHPGNGALRALSAALRSLVDAATAPDSALTALQRVNVTGRLVLDDRVHNTTTVFSDTALSFARDADGAPTLTVAADGPAGRWSLSARAAAEADGTRRLTVSADNLSLDEITLAGGLKSLGFDFDMPVAAHLDLRVGPGGEIAAASGTFALGAGYFKLDDPDHEPMLIDGLAGGFRFDPAAGAVLIERTELRAATSDFTLTGRVDLPRGAGDPWTSAIDASGIVGAERPNEKPIRIARAGIGFRYFPADRHFALDRFDVSGPEVDFSGTADIRSGPAGLRVHDVSTVRHMPAQTLVRLWPSFVAAPVRAWLLANLKGGTVDGGTATADLDDADFALMKAERSVADGHVRVDFGVSGVSLAFMAGVPPLSDLSATGTVTGRTFAMTVAHGDMDVAAGKRLQLAEGSTFRIPDNDPKPMPAFVDAHVTGAIETMAELLQRDALKPYADLPADSGTLHGQIDGRLDVQFPIGKDVPANAAAFSVTATATGLAVDKLVGKEGLTDATVKVDVDPKTGLHAKGEGRLYGAQTSIDLHKPPGGPGEAVIALTLDEAARAKAGMTAAGLKGPVAVKVTAALSNGEKTRAAVDVDFGRASIDGLVPGFAKPAGRPARATLTVLQRDGGVTLDNLSFEGNGAIVRGRVDLDRDGDFASARFAQVKLSPGDEMGIDAQQSGDTLKVTARAANLDARPFLKWMSAPSAPGGVAGAKGSLDLDLHASILTGQNSQAVTGAELRLLRRGKEIRRVTLAGRLGRQPLTVATSQIDNAPHFLVHAGDAGAALLFMDLYKRMAGGRLDANLVMLGQRLDGYAAVHDFTVRDDPAVRKLAVEGLASQRRDDGGAAADATGIDPSAMSFRKLEASFSKTGNIVEVRDGSMFGPALGATVSGTVDFARDQVNLGGTFVPLFGVNNLFSQLPVLGPLLGGGRHEGLLGLNYKITGSAANPVLNVNPLSVLAPGFLRQIFGAIDGSAQRAPTAGDDALRLGQE